MNARMIIAMLAGALTLTACPAAEENNTTPDASTQSDGGSTLEDVGADDADGAGDDSGPTADAGGEDTGPDDVGAEDAGLEDMGPADAGDDAGDEDMAPDMDTLPPLPPSPWAACETVCADYLAASAGCGQQEFTQEVCVRSCSLAPAASETCLVDMTDFVTCVDREQDTYACGEIGADPVTCIGEGYFSWINCGRTTDSATAFCQLSIDAGCGSSPPSLDECVSGWITGSDLCDIESSRLSLCTQFTPGVAFTCDGNGEIDYGICQDEVDAFRACIAGG